MSPPHSSRLKVALVATAIFVIGVVAGASNVRVQRTQATGELMHEAATVAAAFEPEELTALAGNRSDLNGPLYGAIKHRLQKLKLADPRVRSIYLLRADASGRVIFLADANAENATGAVPPGDRFDQATRSSPVDSVVHTGEPSYDGPQHDDLGTWLTGFAAISGPGREVKPGAPLHLVGVDYEADSWTRDLCLAGVRGALYAWVLLGLPMFAFLTTRHRDEQREAIRNLSEAVEQSHSAITILDLEHRIEYANRGLCQQIGYARRELIGRHWRDFIVGPASAATIADLVSTIRMGRTWEGEWLNQRKDGTAYPVHGMVTPVKHRDGSLSCFVAILDDVTEIKRKEAELREARDLAQAGDRAKGQFLATMSHEVRTPLNGIVGFTSLLLETPLSAEQREFVQTIRASGEALIQLTGDILDYARIESGKLKLDPIACDPRECVEEALDLHATRAAEKNIELLHQAADNVPSAVIVDGGRLRQVLVNLVGNAVKFTDHGEVAVMVRALDEAVADTDTNAAEPAQRMCVLEFTIRDTGIGITPEQQTRLFKPFSQVDESSTRRYGGAGLGLAICKNLVHLMGGTIHLASSAGAGTTLTFTIRVPVAVAEPPVRDLDDLRVGLGIQPGSLRRELVGLLSSWGAVVREADSAAELAGGDWDIAMVEIDAPFAAELATHNEPLAGLPPEKTLGLVPISLSSELRSALRTHFRLLVNRPVHHGPLFAMLSGSRPTSPNASRTSTQFGFRALVVEDNEVNQRLLLRVLGTLGCTGSVVTNGIEAINELRERAPEFDVVLLDLHMPEMDGLQALERIRRGEAGPRARTMWVIALTADARPEQRARGFATGLNDYLTKPLRTAELESALRRYRAERLARKT